ncbi:hypothetical protein G7054_g14939 [Neopestalotiopsis clavispora]|nr:hypothetical protein G7054_g14939 [Neopestalotiopsis clavispora]
MDSWPLLGPGLGCPGGKYPLFWLAAAAAVGGGCCCLFLLRWRMRKKIPRASRPRAAIPPTTPPTMAPVELPEEEEEDDAAAAVELAELPLLVADDVDDEADVEPGRLSSPEVAELRVLEDV